MPAPRQSPPGHYDLVVRGGIVVRPEGRLRADIGVAEGRIAAIGDLSCIGAAEVFSAAGLHVLPGVIDTQVHFREPGLEWKDDLESGSRQAVLGGVTSVFEMPNTRPPTTTPALLRDKLARAAGRMHCDHAFYAGATADNIEELPLLENQPGCCGVKIFMGSSTGSLLVADDPTLERILRSGVRRVAVHAEDEERLLRRAARARPGDWSSHPAVRDVASAVRATARLIALARRTRRPVHLLHVSTAEELALLRDAPPIVSAEVLPNHLTLAAPDAYRRLAGRAQQNPPIRGARHRTALWRAVRAGEIDVIGSDHAPHTLEEKARPYPASPSGTPGVQTLVPVMLTHVAAGRLTLERFVELTSEGPRRLFDIAGKGRIAPGCDADLTLVDLSARRVIRNEWIAGTNAWTPFDGMEAHGWPVATIIRGVLVMRDGGIIPPAVGSPIRFSSSGPCGVRQ